MRTASSSSRKDISFGTAPRQVLAEEGLETLGIAATRYTQAARAAVERGLRPADRPMPVTLRRRDRILWPMNIAVTDLTFTYPSGVQALRGVTLTLLSGEAVAIVGENGAGKTTLVKQFNGLLRPRPAR